MRELLELQTGQVSFISGLMSGFALSVAAHVLRYGTRSRMAQTVFILLVASSLLFLLALYVDVRLSIELAGYDALAQEVAARVGSVRVIGTSSATVALFLFVFAIGLLGWLSTPFIGLVSSLMAGGVLYALWLVMDNVADITTLLAVVPGK